MRREQQSAHNSTIKTNLILVLLLATLKMTRPSLFRFKRIIAVFAGVPLLGELPPEYVEFLTEARRRGFA